MHQEHIQELTEAKLHLTRFVLRKAIDTAQTMGFSYTPTPDAPSTYEELVIAFDRSALTGAPLPISSLHCDNVIYADGMTNVAMRFWHDVHHVRHGLSFSLSDELELGLWHLEQLKQAGFDQDSTVAKMMRIDLLGQNYLQGIAKRFPLDQKRFVMRCLELGLDEGVLEEARLPV